MSRALKLGAMLALSAALLVSIKLMSRANGEARGGAQAEPRNGAQTAPRNGAQTAPRNGAQAEERLCPAHSERYFACKTGKGKRIELCKQEQVEYRFGTPAKIELSYPKAAADPPLRFAAFARAGTQRAEVTFQVGGASYAVFDYEEDGKQEAGVRATLASGKEVVFACQGAVESRLFALKALLPCDADNALNLGGCGP